MWWAGCAVALPLTMREWHQPVGDRRLTHHLLPPNPSSICQPNVQGYIISILVFGIIEERCEYEFGRGMIDIYNRLWRKCPLPKMRWESSLSLGTSPRQIHGSAIYFSGVCSLRTDHTCMSLPTSLTASSPALKPRPCVTHTHTCTHAVFVFVFGNISYTDQGSGDSLLMATKDICHRQDFNSCHLRGGPTKCFY